MRHHLTDLSLRAKLVATCSALVLGLTAVLLVWLPSAMDRQSMRWVTSRSLGLGHLLASAVEAPLDFEDAAAARQALATLGSSRGAAYAVLRRADGVPLAEWHRGGEAVVAPGGDGEGAEVIGGLLRVRVPVRTRSGHVAGLLLGFDLDELQERRREARAAVLGAAAVFMLAGLGLALAIGTVLSRPLRRITEVAQRVAAGQAAGAHQLPVERRDEAGQLATAFARMLEKLWSQQRQIEVINADLAEQVAARTGELSRTNEALEQLRRTQEQLVMADRRLSVGRLAAGVAHEINNPMAFIAGNLDFLAAELPEVADQIRAGAAAAALGRFEELVSAVAESRQGTRRVVHIVRSLKTFARDDEDRREVVRLDRPLEAAIEMAHHEIKHRARLERRYDAYPEVEANEVRLSQVFLNLLINAAQAIPDGDPGPHEIRVRLGLDGAGRALVEVSDTGAGIAPEVLGRIFDPFFTTKAVGEGSGLGLPISRNIVTAFGGEIAVESAPGRGSTFRVTLPLAGAPAGPVRTPPPVPRLQGLRVLVVDDEPLVGQMVVRVLGREAEVVAVTSAREALRVLRDGPPFDRVLCDLMMPEMGGPELHAELLRVAPEVVPRLIFMTGGAFTEAARAFLAGWRGPLLEKPLEHETLRRLMHDGPA